MYCPSSPPPPSPSMPAILVFTLLLAMAFWLHRVYQVARRFLQFWEIRTFYHHALSITTVSAALYTRNPHSVTLTEVAGSNVLAGILQLSHALFDHVLLVPLLASFTLTLWCIYSHSAFLSQHDWASSNVTPCTMIHTRCHSTIYHVHVYCTSEAKCIHVVVIGMNIVYVWVFMVCRPVKESRVRFVFSDVIPCSHSPQSELSLCLSLSVSPTPTPSSILDGVGTYM